jgi:hypothetical protein
MSSVSVDLTHDQKNHQFSLKIDGREVRGVRSYEIKASVDEMPTITLTLIAQDIVVNGVYHPEYNTIDGAADHVEKPKTKPVDPV